MRIGSSIALALLLLPSLSAADPPPSSTGRHIDEVTAIWGEPDKIKRDGKGGRVYVYKLSSSIGGKPSANLEVTTPADHGYEPGYSQYVSTQGGVLSTRHPFKRVELHVDEQGRVTRERYRVDRRAWGDSTPPPGKWWEPGRSE